MNSNDNYTPKYVQIKNYIINKIESGDFNVGDKIPSENILSEQFNVSRITANCAIKELSNVGIVERIRGKGTFVKKKSTANTTTAMAFLDNIRLSEVTLGSRKHNLLKQGIVEPTDEIKEKLHLNDNDLVYELVRLMYDDEVVTSIDYTYIPISVFGNHTINHAEIEKSYMHEYLKKTLKYNIKYVNIFINTKALSNYELSLLNATAEDNFTIWDTIVLDDKKNIIATTSTISKTNNMKPFITFEI